MADTCGNCAGWKARAEHAQRQLADERRRRGLLQSGVQSVQTLIGRELEKATMPPPVLVRRVAGQLGAVVENAMGR